jgi:acetyl esterase/lipase
MGFPRIIRPTWLAWLAGVIAALIDGTARAAPPSSGPAHDRYEVRTVKDVSYYEGKGADRTRHKLDLFLPRGKNNFPVIVFVHGGAWMYGDKSAAGLYSAVGRCLAENGVGAVLPNYRLSPRVKHPEHVKDVARAFAWTHKNIADHGGDPGRLFVGGHSAGGHLAALLATDETYLKAEGLTRRSVRGVIAVSGVYRIPDKLSLDMPQLGGLPAGKLDLGFNPFNVVFGKDSKARESASPVAHVGPGLPPFLIVYAEHDLPLLPGMAEELAEALKDNKCAVELLRAKDRFHATVIFAATSKDDPVAKAMLQFIDKHSGQ